MRILKDGTIKYKKSALDHAEWMAQDPLPMRSFRKGTLVKVFMGAGWSKGKVVQWATDGVTVYLTRERRNCRVCDNRNIKEDSAK